MRKRIRETTMACWWPSRYNLAGIKTPDWEGIVGELEYLLQGERHRLTIGASTSGAIKSLEEMRGYAAKRLVVKL